MSERTSYAGTHKARAVSWALGGERGKEQIAIMFEILEGHLQGRKTTAYLSFSDAAVDYTMEKMRNCGWGSDSLAELDSLGNNEVELVIEDEVWEGKTRSKVKFINKANRLTLKNALDDNAIAAFAARMRGKAVASKQKFGAQPAPAARKEAPAGGNGSRWGGDGDPGPEDDDSIPF